VRHRGFNLALRAYDASLVALRSRRASPNLATPRRLLVCIGGHLGDAVLATTTFPALRAAYPETSIGVLAPSWSLPVFEDHPAVRWRHAFDHWKTNRAASARERWAAYRRSARRALGEIDAVGYDTAVDLYPFFPNAAHLLSKCAIPVRIGYTSGGGGPLYSHAMAWPDDGQHTAERHQALLRSFLPNISAESPRYDLPPIAPADAERGRSLLRQLGLGGRQYVVVHPGAGDPRKRWPAHEWTAVTRALRRRDPELRVVLTGHGDSDAAFADEIRGGDGAVLSACNRTSLGVLRYVLAHASLLIGADSLAAHLAAAHDVPCVVIMAAMSDPAHWRPLGPRVRVLTNPVSCAPCYRSKGCPTMACVRGVTPETVERVAVDILRSTDAVPA
jgi:ADP-heptose:LPS heptosyltransferase